MSYSYDIGGLDLFADPFRSPQIQRTQASRQQTKTSVMQPKAQATSMQQPKNKTSTVPQTEKTQPRATQSTNTQKPNISDKPVVEEKSPDTEAKVSAPQAEAMNVTVQTKKPQVETAKNTVQEEKQQTVDTQPAIQKKDLVLDMSEDTAITDKPLTVSDDAKRKAHEAAEAKRKAEWEEKQIAKKKAEEAAIQKLQEMSDSDAVSASTGRISADVERITRRNMKECVSEHIQSICRKDPTFARRTMHPRKSMINCFKYINRMAKEFIKQEMEDNGIKPDNGGYGSDVPDGIVYQWAEDYFHATDAPEDREKEETFVPRPYVGGSSKPTSKTKSAAKKPKANTDKKEAKENANAKGNYEQMTLGV